MAPDRRTCRREGEARRREALIGAALALVASGGSQAATVRAIADRAGVTPGLIRRCFQGQDDLTRAAHAHVVTRTRAVSAAVRDGAGSDTAARLAGFGADPAVLRDLAIACNAVLDGLWPEGSILPEAFAAQELPRIAIASVGAILDIDLAAALPEPETQT